MIKGSIHWGDITILNGQATNNRTLKGMKQKLIGERDKSTIIAGDLHPPLSAIALTTKEKIIRFFPTAKLPW